MSPMHFAKSGVRAAILYGCQRSCLSNAPQRIPTSIPARSTSLEGQCWGASFVFCEFCAFCLSVRPLLSVLPCLFDLSCRVPSCRNLSSLVCLAYFVLSVLLSSVSFVSSVRLTVCDPLSLCLFVTLSVCRSGCLSWRSWLSWLSWLPRHVCLDLSCVLSCPCCRIRLSLVLPSPFLPCPGLSSSCLSCAV